MTILVTEPWFIFDGLGLFWSNEDGWVGRDSGPTAFKESEIHSPIPRNSMEAEPRWVKQSEIATLPHAEDCWCSECEAPEPHPATCQCYSCEDA